MTVHSVAITVHRTNVLNINQKKHWAPKSEIVAVLNQTGAIHARRLPRMERAHVLVHVAYPSKKRVRDVYNLYPTAKAIVDGMVGGKKKAGILPDDDDAHLEGPDMRPSPSNSGSKDHYRFTFTITDLSHV